MYNSLNKRRSKTSKSANSNNVSYECDALHMNGQESEYYSYNSSDLREVMELAKADVADNCGIIEDPCYVCLKVTIVYGELSLEFTPDSDEDFGGKIRVKLGDKEKEYHICNFMCFSIENEIEKLKGTFEGQLLEMLDYEEVPF